MLAVRRYVAMRLRDSSATAPLRENPRQTAPAEAAEHHPERTEVDQPSYELLPPRRDREASRTGGHTDMVSHVHEILPGIYHWTAVHPNIHVEVDSYWLDDGGVLIDPLVPPDRGVEWFEDRPTPPQAVVLSNRHHYRQSGQFGVPVHVIRAGLHEFEGTDREVTAFDFGDELPGGLVAHQVDAICPDDTALYLPSAKAVWFADGLVKSGPRGTQGEGTLGFVPDSLMDEPPKTKEGLLSAFARLLDELDFEHVLMAHGGPVIGDGRAQLQELVDSGGRTAFEF